LRCIWCYHRRLLGQPRPATSQPVDKTHSQPVDKTQSRWPHKLWPRTWDTGLLYLLVAVLLIPLWSVSNLPTQDGPLHLANAVTLMHYDDPGWETSRQYYEFNDPGFPTWLIHLFLGWLSSVFSAPIAEKILLTLYVAGLPLAFCFALRPLTNTPQLGGLLVLPVVYNYTFQMGFYAFLLGIVLLFVLLGIWLRCQKRLTAGLAVAACIVSYFTFQLHPFSWVMTALALGCIELVDYCNVLRSRPSRAERLASVVKIFAKRWCLYVVTIVPAMVHTCIFLSVQGATPSLVASKVAEKAGTSSAAWSFAVKRLSILVDRSIELFSLSSLVSFSRLEMVFSIGLLVSLVLLTFLCAGATRPSGESRPRGRFLLLALFYLAFYLVTKDSIAGGAFVAPRIQLLALLSFIAWVASSVGLAQYRVLVSCLSALIVVPSAAYYTLTYREFERDIVRELSLAEHMAEGSTIMPVVLPALDREPSIFSSVTPTPNFLLHADGHFVRLRRMVDLGNYQGWKGYFPIRFRQQFNPMQHIAVDGKIELDLNERLPDLNLAGYGDGRVFVDYVVIVGSIDHFQNEPEIRSLLSQLTQSYDEIATQPGQPPISLFRHKRSTKR